MGHSNCQYILHHQHLRISCVCINIGCNRTQNFLPPHNNIQPHPLQTFHKEYYIFDWLNQGIDKIGRLRKTGIQNAIFKSTIMVIKNKFMIHSIICGLFQAKMCGQQNTIRVVVLTLCGNAKSPQYKYYVQLKQNAIVQCFNNKTQSWKGQDRK